MTTPVVPQSPDTKTFFKAVYEFFEENRIELSENWEHLSKLPATTGVLVPMFGYNIGYASMWCDDVFNVYSFTVLTKEKSLEEGCRELTEIMQKDNCTVYSALYSMLFDFLTWTPVVKKGGKGVCKSIDLYEYGDWDWKHLNEFLCEKFPGISENFVEPTILFVP